MKNFERRWGANINIGERKVHLRPQEAQLYEALISAAGGIVASESLISLLGSPSSLNNTLHRLREKLKPEVEIQNYTREGYGIDPKDK